jgi:hypothetical protein
MRQRKSQRSFKEDQRKPSAEAVGNSILIPHAIVKEIDEISLQIVALVGIPENAERYAEVMVLLLSAVR